MKTTKKWIDKDGRLWNGLSIVLDDMRVWNPSDEQMVAAGYTEYVEPEPVPPTPEELLEQAKAGKIEALEGYDKSDAVNGFDISVGGQTITGWLTPAERANYKNSLDSAELLGLEVVHPVFGGQELTIPVQTAKMALAQIQIYADRCYIATEQHRTAIEQLQTIEDVEAYDYTAGYPDRLVFEL